MQIRVRNFKGIAKADIKVGPGEIALVAGNNRAGKSSLAQAIGAVLAAEPGLLRFKKAEAGKLVHLGAAKGYAAIRYDAAGGDDPAEAIANWPSLDFETRGSPPPCSRYSAGLISVIDLPARERASELAKWLKTNPTKAELTEAATEAGASEATIEALIKRIGGDGWDVAHKHHQARGQEMKGQWREATGGNQYGSKKGAEWRPDHWSDALEAAKSPGALETAVAKAEAAVDEAVGAEAVGEAEIKRLKAVAGEIEARKAEATAAADILAERERALAAAEAEYAEMPWAVKVPQPCPHCGEPLCIREEPGKKWIDKAPSGNADEIAEMQKKRSEASSAIEGKRREIREAVSAKDAADKAVAEAEAAAETIKGLADHAGKQADKAAERIDAREALEAAMQDLAAYRQHRRAQELHESIAANQKLIDVLAPEGLRQTVLNRAVGKFNRDVLGALCETAGWPEIRVDGDLEVLMHERPPILCSGSERWQARTILQLAFARLEKAPLVVLDEADILDPKQRNELFALLAREARATILCMTTGSPKSTPNLASKDVGLGRTYWIERAEAGEIEAEAAA